VAGDTVTEEEIASQNQQLGTASLTFTSSSATGYCAKVSLQNALTVDSPRWQAVIDMKGSKLLSSTNSSFFSSNVGKLLAKPPHLNTRIAKNAKTEFTFCGSSTSTAQRPVIQAWNFESDAYATCPTNSGILPTFGALAVSAAREMKRWDPLTDFYIDGNYNVQLSSAGAAKCGNGCPNTKAIIGQQFVDFVPTSEFNAEMFRTAMYSAFQRHKDKIDDLNRNKPGELPPAHKLTQVGGPINLGLGACGPHYIFQADNLDGTPLTTAKAANLANSLCFFGQGSCGGNPYIHFVTTTQGCPSGRTCVAIDPTDGDNSSTSTTTAGSAPTYPLNRAYDPANALLNSGCVTTSGLYGTMQSKCSVKPSTCGYLYCTPTQ
jgi:hypothetical protein